jgi:hypothetical protein
LWEDFTWFRYHLGLKMEPYLSLAWQSDFHWLWKRWNQFTCNFSADFLWSPDNSQAKQFPLLQLQGSPQHLQKL